MLSERLNTSLFIYSNHLSFVSSNNYINILSMLFIFLIFLIFSLESPTELLKFIFMMLF